MTTAITYCANGCTRNTSSGDHIRVQTDPPSQICRKCEDNLHDWLTAIPDLYANLPLLIEPGTVEKNPDAKTTKKAEAAAPMRLDVIDLLDTRLGRKWNGTAPAHLRRGILGDLDVLADHILEARQITNPFTGTPTVAQLCAFLDRHRLWAAEQDDIKQLHDDIKRIHRVLSDANGEYRRPPVGHCHIETDAGRCGGPLFANTYGGVRCAKCAATWDADHLRQLGLAQAEAQEAG